MELKDKLPEIDTVDGFQDLEGAVSASLLPLDDVLHMIRSRNSPRVAKRAKLVANIVILYVVRATKRSSHGVRSLLYMFLSPKLQLLRASLHDWEGEVNPTSLSLCQISFWILGDWEG